MSLVEDHRRGLGQNARVGRTSGLALDGNVGEKQMMIHDDNVRLKRLAPHLGNKAAAVIRTS